MRASLVPALLTLVLSSCSIRIPDAKYVCSDDQACPSGFVCSDGLCRRDRIEADAEVDANPCVAETCNGLDDDCDGFVDDGVASVSSPAIVASTANTPWSEVVPLDAGGLLVLAAIPGLTTSTYDIIATSFDADGAVVLGPLDVADSSYSRFEATAFEGNFHILRKSATNGDLVLDQFDVVTFARVGTELTVAAEPYDGDVIDMVVNETANGDKLAIVYRANDEVKIVNADIPSLSFSTGGARTVHAQTAEDPTYAYIRLVSAPCSKGLYLAGLRVDAEPELRVHALTAFGDAAAPPLEISADAPNFAVGVARPLLVGGDCVDGPTEIVVGWTEADQPLSGVSTVSLERVDRFAISRSTQAPTQTFERVGRWSLVPDALVLPQATIVMLEPVAFTRLDDGRVIGGLSTFASDGSSASFEVYELMPDGSSIRHETSLAPIAPGKVDVVSTDGTLAGVRFGGGLFTDDREARSLRMTCSP